jgi:hypothetical protein
MKPRAIIPFFIDSLLRFIQGPLRVAACVLGVVCLWAAAAPASADALSSARMGPLVITLYDLDPGDGLAPSIVFDNPGLPSHVHASAISSGDGYDSQIGEATWPVAHGAATSAVSYLAQVYASVAGSPSNPSLIFSSLSMTGAAQALSGNAASYDAYARVPYFTNEGFTLSAHTLAVFSSDAVVDARTTLGYDPLSGRTESASSGAFIDVESGAASADGNVQRSDAFLSADAGYHWDGTNWVGESVSEEGLLTVPFVNLTATNAAGQFYAGADISGLTATAFGGAASAAPEPETYVLLLAGLGLGAGMARRRRTGVHCS